MTYPDLYALSDGIKALKGLFDLHSTCTLNEEGIDVVRNELERLRQMALALEHEKSRGLWNAAAHADQDGLDHQQKMTGRAARYARVEDRLAREAELTNMVCDEVERPGTNVRLFPVIRRGLS